MASDVQVSSPYAKFLIGALAGCSAIAIPRLSSYFVAKGDGGFDYFPLSYLVAIAVFSIFLGLLIAIMEYKLPRAPKETFFAALAIPGLIAGSLNMAVETTDANNRYQELSTLSEEVRKENNIMIESIQSIEVVPLDLSQTNTAPSFNIQLISSAYAKESGGELVTEEGVKSFLIQRDAPKFAVSLGRYGNKADAMAAVKNIAKQNPSVTLIKTGQGYELLSSDKLLSETQATIEAMKIKRELGITPRLLELQ